MTRNNKRSAEMPVVVRGHGMTLADVMRVSRRGAQVRLTDERAILEPVRRSRQVIIDAVAAGAPIYGVTTVFGGMANIAVPKEEAVDLQNNIPWPHKTGAGARLPVWAVRAAMLLRANALMRGASGVSLEIIGRLVDLLNAGAAPHVYEWGSIGASGDLVPLAYIIGAAVGLDPSFRMSLGEEDDLDCITVLECLGLSRLRLGVKEGLSVMNGTSVMAGIAAHCVENSRTLLALSMGVHAIFLQAMGASDQPFHPYVHRQKPHPGQCWSAARILDLTAGSRLIRNGAGSRERLAENDLVQDRYSLRCLPQYMGPIVDGITVCARQVGVEINSATDNPLVDPASGTYLYCGNFLGQYIGVAMDQLRYHIGLLAKHLDVQIAMLVAPEFNGGLPPSLVGNPSRRVNLGLKGLQISCNSIMPLLSFLGNSLVDRFPTHAEQFNQNINSQGYGSANLARQSIDMFRQYMAMALMFAVQAADLRTHLAAGHYDARKILSPSGARLYEAVFQAIGRSPSAEKPYIWNDDEQPLDLDIRRIAADIENDGIIPEAVREIVDSLEAHVP